MKGDRIVEICVNGLDFAYQEQRILNHLMLKVEKGESVGIIGMSGCGKSTLLKFLSGLYEAEDGSVTVAGETEGEKIRRNVAMVMQNAMLLPATIRENITCGHPMEESWIQHVCETAKLSEWIHSLPEGLDSHLGKRGDALSGGQAQRIAIARAMAKNAPIILLDEPTSALDQKTSIAVMDAILQLTRGKTVVHVTHHPKLLMEFDRILRMEGGRLYEAGNEVVLQEV